MNFLSIILDAFLWNVADDFAVDFRVYSGVTVINRDQWGLFRSTHAWHHLHHVLRVSHIFKLLLTTNRSGTWHLRLWRASLYRVSCTSGSIWSSATSSEDPRQCELLTCFTTCLMKALSIWTRSQTCSSERFVIHSTLFFFPTERIKCLCFFKCLCS